MRRKGWRLPISMKRVAARGALASAIWGAYLVWQITCDGARPAGPGSGLVTMVPVRHAV
jgi:hypothetical protein